MNMASFARTLRASLWAVRYWLAAKRPLRGQAGATVAEYSLLLALVVIILIGALTELGGALNDKLQAIIQQINQAQ